MTSDPFKELKAEISKLTKEAYNQGLYDGVRSFVEAVDMTGVTAEQAIVAMRKFLRETVPPLRTPGLVSSDKLWEPWL